MQHEIDLAFGHRQRPAKVTDVIICSSLRDDALQLGAKDWRSVTPQDWLQYSDAFFGFSPEAFVYFLPSILSLSAKHSPALPAAEAVITELDTSADPEIWPEWFAQRFLLLTSEELKVLRHWSLQYFGNGETEEGSQFVRVQDTLAMLELMLEG